MRRERLAAAAPVALAAAVYSITALGRAVADADEAVYVQIPREMLARGDWVTPFVNGVRSLDKPPLLYWLIALCYKLFGQSEFIARIPSILGVCGTVWLIERLTHRLAGARAAVAAGLAFAFCAGTFLFTLEVMHDIVLVFFLTLAMYCFVAMIDAPARPWPVLGLFAAAAGAFLSKGLLGIALPAGIVMTYAAVTRRLPPVRWRWLALGGLLFAALALPWHIAMEARHPGFLRVHFVEEQILRFLGRREPVDYTSVPLPLFWALLPVWLFPWSVFLPGAWLLRMHSRAVLVAGCWAGWLLAFFSLSSRLEHYAFPLLPPLAILAGTALASTGAHRATARAFQILTGLAGLLAAAAVLLAAVWLTGYGLDFDGAHPERTHSTDFGILADFPAETIRALLPPAIAVSLALAAGLLWARRAPLLCLTLAMVVFDGAAAFSIRAAEGVVSSKAFGTVLARLGRPEDTVVVFGDYETANSIHFYAPVRLYVCEGAAPSLRPGLRYPDAPPLLWSRQELARQWGSRGRVWLIVDEERLAALGLAPAFRVTASAGRLLVTNQALVN
jgi:4-amino-4-deoxy-L-arabinose transferase-like glycosyltransferase